MNQILARAPLSPREPWSAWLMGERPAQHGAALHSLDGAPAQWPAAQEVVLLVPAGMLSWHRVTLPRLPRHRWPQALAGLLEDQLLAEASSLHFAVAPETTPGAPTWVAVCDKTWLTQAVEALHAAGRSAQRIVPEFEPGAPTWQVLGPAQAAQLVITGEDGVQLLPLPEPLAESLSAWARQADGPALAPESAATPAAALWAEPAVADAVQQVLGRPAGLLPLAQRLRHALESQWNLAQFDLAASPAKRWRERALRGWHSWRQAPAWRPMRWGLTALLLLQLAAVQTWIWRQSAQPQQEEMKAILRSSFPQVTLVIDPLLQMQREVEQLQRASGTASAADLAVMLSVLAESEAPAPRRLEYAAGQLQLADWPLEAARAAQLQSALALRGYQLQANGAQWLMKVKAP
jgi:general secretion pathway protein L